jgi:hypothetical protein
MAIERIITWSCPTGNFADGTEANRNLQQWRGGVFAATDPSGYVETVINASQYFSKPTQLIWDNTTKTLSLVMTFPDQTALDNHTAAYNTFSAGHQDPDEIGPPTWQRVSAVQITV